MYIHAKLMTWSHNYDNATNQARASSEEDIFCGLGNTAYTYLDGGLVNICYTPQ